MPPTDVLEPAYAEEQTKSEEIKAWEKDEQ